MRFVVWVVRPSNPAPIRSGTRLSLRGFAHYLTKELSAIQTHTIALKLNGQGNARNREANGGGRGECVWHKSERNEPSVYRVYPFLTIRIRLPPASQFTFVM